MAEQYTLVTPESTPATSNTSYRVTRLVFDWTLAQIEVRLVGEHNEVIVTGYGGPPPVPQADRDEAIKFMKQVNTMNFSTTSMHKRILQKLGLEGKIPPGQTTGTPDPVTP